MKPLALHLLSTMRRLYILLQYRGSLPSFVVHNGYTVVPWSRQERVFESSSYLRSSAKALLLCEVFDHDFSRVLYL